MGADRRDEEMVPPHHVSRADWSVPGERLEAKRAGREERADKRPAYMPLVSEPAEERPREEPADDDRHVADEESTRVRERVLRPLNRAVRHQEVAEQSRVRAAETEERGTARRPLRATRDKGEDEPRRRKAGHLRAPGMPHQAAKVLVSGAKSRGNHKRKEDPHRTEM